MGAAGLRAQIEELERSVPATLSGAEGTSAEQTTTEQIPGRSSPSGLGNSPRDLGARRRPAAAVPQRTHTGSADPIHRSSYGAAKELRGPLVANLRSLIQGEIISRPRRPPAISLLLPNRKGNWMRSRPSLSRPPPGCCRSVNKGSCSISIRRLSSAGAMQYATSTATRCEVSWYGWDFSS